MENSKRKRHRWKSLDAYLAVSTNIRDALKKEFPSTNFSVSVFRWGYWGAVFGVKWVEGPSEEEVKKIADVSRRLIAGTTIEYFREDNETP